MERRYTDLLKSERFLIAIGGILAMLAAAALPELESAQSDLIGAFVIVIGVAIAGGSLESAMVALYPFARRIVAATPNKRDDEALNGLVALAAVMGYRLEVAKEEMVKEVGEQVAQAMESATS
jgi:uncharacterized membrane protein YccF (DUF307 family)